MNESEIFQEEPKQRRLRNTTKKIQRQVVIAKQHNIPIKNSHRYNKQSPMNCGNPKCLMCMNPRKVWKQKTIGERKFQQDNGE